MQQAQVETISNTQRLSRWCYQGVWATLTRLFRLPEQPPELVGADDRDTRSFRPAEGFLRYLKFQFWLILLLVDIGLVVLLIAIIASANWLVSVVLTPLILLLIVLPDIFAYLALHLRYDTTWYVLSDRSLRIRRGIWIIRETTITYENIQNVTVSQGPLQRYFGISDVRVETAGGGGESHGSSMGSHQGLLEGVDCAEQIRQQILLKWNQSKSSGLGEQSARGQSAAGNPVEVNNAFSIEQIELLEEIRDLAVRLAGSH